MTVDPLRPARRAAATSVVLALCLTGALAAPAEADPVYPSQEQVDDAKAAVADTASQVGAVEAQLAAASAHLQQVQVAAARAAEDYNEAVVALQEKTAAADAARQAADGARADVESARVEIGRLAATSYRRGGGLSGLEAFLSAGGPQDLLDRAAALENLGERRQSAYQRMEAAELVSKLLDEQAQSAKAAQEQAAEAAEQARARAQQAAETAQSEVAAVAATRAGLIQQLATLRRTSVELETSRQAGLEEERRRREEAAARAAAERREAQRRADERAAADRRAAERRAAAEREQSRSQPARPPASGGSSGSSSESSGSSSGSSGSSGGSSSSAPDPAPSGSSKGSASAGERAVAWARDQVGKPYLWGATGPDSFDCSGLTSQAWQAAGVWITRTSRSQYRAAEKIPYSAMRPGDLIFYGDGSDPGSIYHVALYAGGGMMVEAPRAGVPVRVTSVRMSGSMPYAGRP